VIGALQYMQLMLQAKAEIAELEAKLEAEKIRHAKTRAKYAELVLHVNGGRDE